MAVILSPDHTQLIARAGPLWRDTLRYRKSLTSAQINGRVEELTRIGTQVGDASIIAAAHLLAYLDKDKKGMPKSINVFGTMGCGKTSLAKALAKRFGLEFIDADLFHTPEARAKMGAGIPLELPDRLPFLRKVREHLNKPGRITTCSALTQNYRAFIAGADEAVLLAPPEIDPWRAVPKDSGVLSIFLDKDFRTARAELIHATLHNQRKLPDGADHYIRITEEDSRILRDQYAKFEENPVHPWQAPLVRTAHYRTPVQIREGEPTPPTQYDGKLMLEEVLEMLGVN